MLTRLRPLLLALVLLVPGSLVKSQELEEPPLVAWQELVDHPARYLGKTIRMHAQFQSHVDRWAAYLTRFGSKEYGAFQFWSDEQFPWVQSDYDQPRVRLFTRHGKPAEATLIGAQMYGRYELKLHVCELFLDLPWAEIESARATVEEISEGSNIHAARGMELAGKGSYALAQTEFEQALEGLLPDHAREALEKLRDECKERQGLGAKR
ncbi:MAG: hypothetical protein IPJ19_16175 [Planctomycetes bacterium]|nr:hypothetical protein [Planctomycetota bacterium]